MIYLPNLLNLKNEIILASASPRRRLLLDMFGIRFSTEIADINEDDFTSTEPEKIVMELARKKANEITKRFTDKIIIAADTLVFLNNELLTKPIDKNDAYRILMKLSDKTHQVYTGIAIYNPINSDFELDYEKTNVTFRQLDEKEVRAYIETGSPMDKAGAYGIQDDFGAVFVSKINGCYYNVVGLPLTKLYLMLKKIGNLATN